MLTNRMCILAAASLLSLLVSGCTTTAVLDRAKGKTEKEEVTLEVQTIKQASKSVDGTEALFCVTMFDPETGRAQDSTLHVPLNHKENWNVRESGYRFNRGIGRVVTDIRYLPRVGDLSPECPSAHLKDLLLVQLPEEQLAKLRWEQEGGNVEAFNNNVPEVAYVEVRQEKPISIVYVSAKLILEGTHAINVPLQYSQFQRKAKTEEAKPFFYLLVPFAVVADAVGYIIAAPVIGILMIVQKTAGP